MSKAGRGMFWLLQNVTTTMVMVLCIFAIFDQRDLALNHSHKKKRWSGSGRAVCLAFSSYLKNWATARRDCNNKENGVLNGRNICRGS